MTNFDNDPNAKTHGLAQAQTDLRELIDKFREAYPTADAVIDDETGGTK